MGMKGKCGGLWDGGFILRHGVFRKVMSGARGGPWTRRCTCGSAASRPVGKAAPAPAPVRGESL